MDMLNIYDLQVSIDGKEVLKGINLHIPEGETHILFGKNGSGKSTLLMTLMGFERYRVERGKAGKIRIDHHAYRLHHGLH